MNIPSLEAILTDLDEARRQRNASNRKIEELTDALETQQRVIKQAHEDIAKLTAERDEWEANSGQWEQEYYKASAERDELKAKLAKYDNLKPVAWVCVNEDGECEQIDYGSESPLPGDDGFIPLYALEMK